MHECKAMGCHHARCRGAHALHRFVEAQLRINARPNLRISVAQHARLRALCAEAGEECIAVGRC